jgi:hypothetical protein
LLAVRPKEQSWQNSDVDRECACAGEASDVAGEVAAALAHAAIAFKLEDPAFSAKCWAQAKVAWALTGIEAKKFGASSVAYPLLANYYKSSAVVAHVFFGAASMFTAALELKDAAAEVYKAQAIEVGASKEADGGQKWYWEVPNWDNPWWDGALLMAARGIEGSTVDGSPVFKHFLGVLADKWVHGKDPVKCAPLSHCSLRCHRAQALTSSTHLQEWCLVGNTRSHTYALNHLPQKSTAIERQP